MRRNFRLVSVTKSFPSFPVRVYDVIDGYPRLSAQFLADGWPHPDDIAKLIASPESFVADPEAA